MVRKIPQAAGTLLSDGVVADQSLELRKLGTLNHSTPGTNLGRCEYLTRCPVALHTKRVRQRIFPNEHLALAGGARWWRSLVTSMKLTLLSVRALGFFIEPVG